MINESVLEISRKEFEDHGAVCAPKAQLDELHYYAALDGHYLGVVFKYRGESDYGFGILGPDTKGKKRWIDGVATGLSTQDQAQAGVRQSLMAQAALGKQVHPQD